MSVSLTSDPPNFSAGCEPLPVVPVRVNEFAGRLAPIALFVYNRPAHTRRTVEALRANDLARQSDLFVFADAAKTESGAAAVADVRQFIRALDGFKSVTLIEREANAGLSASVISGVTQMCEQYGRVIAVEDDLLTAPDFLTFMNCALDQYADDAGIYSVSGYNFGVQDAGDYPYDAFCSYRSSSWGWGTWKDRWEKADWSVSDYESFSRDKNQQRLLNRGGEDLSWMLGLQMAGRIDSWSIRWDYVHFKHGALAVSPVTARVYNIGFDGSGVHCSKRALKQSGLSSEYLAEFRFPAVAEVNRFFAAEIQRLHRRSLVRKVLQYLKYKMRRR
jgi:hypothetical protein